MTIVKTRLVEGVTTEDYPKKSHILYKCCLYCSKLAGMHLPGVKTSINCDEIAQTLRNILFIELPNWW